MGDSNNLVLITNEAGAKRLPSTFGALHHDLSWIASINAHIIFHQAISIHHSSEPTTMSSKYYLSAIVATILVSSSLVSIAEARDELSPSKEAKDIDNRDLWATWGWSAPEPSGWSGSSKASKGSKGSKSHGSGSDWSGSSKSSKGSKGSKSNHVYGSGSGSGDGGWSAPEPSGDWSAPEPSGDGWHTGGGSSKASKGSKGSKGSGSGDGGWSAPEPSGDAWHGGSGSSKASKGSKGSKSHNAYGSGSGSGDGGWSAPEPSGDGWNGDGYW